MQSSTLAKRGWILFFLAIAVFYLWGLGAIPLVGPDEPRYAQVAREMLSRRDWITPTLGGLPWFEKPALLYWITMASYRVLGVSEYSARVGPAICGLVSAVFVYFVASGIKDLEEFNDAGKKQQTRDGLARYAALVFLSNAGIAAFSRAANFDIVLTMTLTGALSCFWGAGIRAHCSQAPLHESQTRTSGNGRVAGWALFGFYFFVGLSLLAKGLVGVVIPFGIIAVYFVLRREWPRRSLLTSLGWGIPTALAVGAIWYGPMIARHGWTFVDQFIVQHHFARFVTNKYRHPQPLYYYVAVLPLLCVPWTIFLAAAFIAARRWNWRGETSLDRLRVFAVTWLVVPIVFFSFSGSKLPGYILPVLPAAALLVGDQIRSMAVRPHASRILRLTGAFMILLAVAGVWFAIRSTSIPRWWIAAAAAAPVILAGGITLVHSRMRAVLVIPIASLVFFVIVINCGAPAVARAESVQDLLATASARGFGTVHVVQLHTIERTAEFYAAGRLDYGQDGEPVRLESALQVADAARRNDGIVLCFVPLEYQGQLTAYPKVQAEIVADNGRVSLVAVRVR